MRDSRGTSRLAARWLRGEWSGTRGIMPSRSIIEPIMPLVWPSTRRNTAHSVSAARIASGEQQR